MTPYHKQKIKELCDYYEYLKSRNHNPQNKNDDRDFVSSYYRALKGWKNIYEYTEYKKNINLVLQDLNKTNEYLLNEANTFINNFINKYNSLYQNLNIDFLLFVYCPVRKLFTQKIQVGTLILIFFVKVPTCIF